MKNLLIIILIIFMLLFISCTKNPSGNKGIYSLKEELYK